MEMHQVRYFLAAVSELNFTKAAERCNVSQRSLTRAIMHLQRELGGDLFRRDRQQPQLTDRRQDRRLLKQCYDSALGARSLASAIKGGEVGSLRLALSRTVGLDLLTGYFSELGRHFAGLEMKLARGTAADVVELLKKGDAELAIAGTIDESWERLDKWPLFTERFQLVVNRKHPLAERSQIDVDDLKGQQFLRRTYCEDAAQTSALLRSHSIEAERGHDVPTDEDLRALIEADFVVAFAPRSMQTPAALAKVPVSEIELSRTVYVYGVAGRQRTAVASAMLKMLRAADWSRYCS